MSTKKEDKAAILARRAAFIATAVAALTQNECKRSDPGPSPCLEPMPYDGDAGGGGDAGGPEPMLYDGGQKEKEPGSVVPAPCLSAPPLHSGPPPSPCLSVPAQQPDAGPLPEPRPCLSPPPEPRPCLKPVQPEPRPCLSKAK